MLTEDLQEMAAIGADGGGVTRLAWSPDLSSANEWLVRRLRDLGLEVGIDAAGNVVGKWQAGAGKALVCGSHLDTVPRGGRYDGALGVLAALHAVRLLKESGFQPRRPIWVVSFNDEEGTRFGTGMLGSRAFAGDDLSQFADRPDPAGVTVHEAMTAAGFDFERLPAARAIEEVEAYLELHIEQGPRLEDVGVDIGVVSGIVGISLFRARLVGEANHAGTTPMDRRRDALCGAARVVLALRQEALQSGTMTANVGRISVQPGGYNVIPGECEFSIDVRATSTDGQVRAEEFVGETLRRVASEEGLEMELQQLHRLPAVPMDPRLRETLARAAALEGATTCPMPSGAGHDAMNLGRHVPAGMIFVPSRGGISHSPQEHTAPEHCELGTRVLSRALRLLAG
jgi:allantoate deiminase